jgi:prepilin-type N-terminal cleavage/methylation domain-containing protein
MMDLTMMLARQNPQHAFNELGTWARNRFGLELTEDDIKKTNPQKIAEMLREEQQKFVDEDRLNTTIDEALKVEGDDELDTYLKDHLGEGVTPRMRFLEGEEREDAIRARCENLMRTELLFFERTILLETLDSSWKDHLYEMDKLRDVIGFRAFSQVDPKIQYKREGAQLFNQMLEGVRDRVTDFIFKASINPAAALGMQAGMQPGGMPRPPARPQGQAGGQPGGQPGARPAQQPARRPASAGNIMGSSIVGPGFAMMPQMAPSPKPTPGPQAQPGIRSEGRRPLREARGRLNRATVSVIKRFSKSRNALSHQEAVSARIDCEPTAGIALSIRVPRTRGGANRDHTQEHGMGRERARGFTLIELLVVIAIISLLITIVTTVGAAALSGGRARQTQDTIRAVDSAVTTYLNDVGTMPPAFVPAFAPMVAFNGTEPPVPTRESFAAYPLLDGVDLTNGDEENRTRINSMGLFMRALDEVGLGETLSSVPAEALTRWDGDGELVDEANGTLPPTGTVGNQPEMRTILDGWGRPLRFVHPAWDGLVTLEDNQGNARAIGAMGTGVIPIAPDEGSFTENTSGSPPAGPRSATTRASRTTSRSSSSAAIS